MKKAIRAAARALKRPFKAVEERFLPGRVFTRIYERGRWKSGGTPSGAGSTLEQTARIRAQLPALLQRHGIRTIVDVPCGDFNWIGTLDYRFTNYVGGDIVDSLVTRNRQLHAAPDRAFQRLDVIADPIPRADVLLCRDCWVHLSTAQIQRAIRNVARSECTYLLTTTYPETPANADVSTGNWRPINLRAEPFSFPEPLEIIPDGAEGASGQFSDKSLALWRVADLRR